MTKADMVSKLADEIKVTKVAAAKALSVFTGSVEAAIRKGERLTIVGFGTFSVSERKARKGRNPRTGKEIRIAAKKAPKFTPGSALKAAANGKTIAAKPKAKKAPAKPAAKAKRK
jgi:DNA-binding protein HU-beta